MTCVSQWFDIVIKRRKPLRWLGNAMDDLGGSTAGSGDDLVLSLERDIEKGAEVYVFQMSGDASEKAWSLFVSEGMVLRVRCLEGL